ncbi:MAG: hypothetical protein QXK49_03105 [Candidatus Aenigmatarchaeota archaeon]
MNKKYFLLAGLVTLGVVAAAVISSYGTITGYVTVEKAIKLDIMGSSNDVNYTLNAKQGETVYSPQIKIDTSANATIPINITLEILPESSGNESDITLTLVNEFKNETLTNPIMITSDFRFYVKHEFKPNANTGNYSFIVSVIPA